MLRGIDVSSWQGVIDWERVRNAGVEFAIIRTGYGRKDPKQIDQYFKENLEGAGKVGIKVGAYHYSYAESPEDAIKEAEFCLEILDGAKLDLPIYYDIEDKSISNKHDKGIRTQMCINFCSTIEKVGYWAGVYANKNWFDNYLNYDQLKSRYTIWLAHYGIDSPSLDCDIWQYTSSGKVDGISGKVDMNYMYRDLLDEIGSNPGQAPKSEVKTTTYTVVSGDTLSGIAMKYNTSWQLLAEINNISNPGLIYAGQVIKVPCTATTNKSLLYTVKSGDSLWSIAQDLLGNGTRFNEIKVLNGLTSDTIYPGQNLKIPR